MLSIEEFKKVFPRCKDPELWIEIMVKLFPKYDINTPRRQAAFLAQCGHECAGWSVFSENLNYSSKALSDLFKSHFEKAGKSINGYARKPEKIANIIYANRMGNGDIDSGDGWKFRGRGPIQLTGRSNYREFGYSIDIDLEKNPDIIINDKQIGLMSAIWFWDKHKLNKLADKEEIEEMTRIINGGYNGLDDRWNKYNQIIDILQKRSFLTKSLLDVVKPIVEIFSKPKKENIKIKEVLRLGSRGQNVKLIQDALNIHSDGIFGTNTENAVKQFQRLNGLKPDGIVGPKTLEKMF